MKKTLLIAISFLFVLTSIAQTGWKWGIKNTGRGGMDSRPSAVDALGNLYVAGHTYGSAFAIDSMVFGANTVYSGGGRFNQMIVTKVDTAGNYLWAIGSKGTHVQANALAVDPSGDIFVVGFYEGRSVTFGAITLSNPSSSSMAFIEKISSAGTVLWAQNIDNLTGSGSSAIDLGIGVDGSGNAYVTGNFDYGMILIGSRLLTNHDLSGLTSDIFLVKYNAAGVIKWAKSFGGNHTDFPFLQGGYAGFDYENNIMSVSPSGNIYLIGRFFSDSIKIGSTTLYNPLGGTTMPGPTYSYLSKWDSSGNPIWAKYVNTKMQVNEIITSPGEDIYMAGKINSSDTWGAFTLNPGALMAKLDSTGMLLWVRTDSGGDAKSISLDDSGSVFVAGSMVDSVSFGGSILYAPAIKTAPMYVAHYDSSGKYISSSAVAGGGNVCNSIRADHINGFYLVGNYFRTPITIGPSLLDTPGILSTTTFIARHQYLVPATIPVLNTVDQYIALANSITLYPNPASNTLTIKSIEKMHTISVTNTVGKLIYSIICNDEMLELDISRITPGIYFVRVNNSSLSKFVKTE